nr:unnamed protein product [Digitaria exilis]
MNKRRANFCVHPCKQTWWKWPILTFPRSLVYLHAKSLAGGTTKLAVATSPVPGSAAPPHDFHLREKTFSRRSRKPPNPCPTLTQRHRCPCETTIDLGWALDLCFGV